MDKKELYAGTGRAVIRMPENFFGHVGPWSGIHDDLHVRAVILDNGERVCLISVEIVSLSNGIREMQEMVSQETGIPADHIWIMASHCFSTPHMMSDSRVNRVSPEESLAGLGFNAAVYSALREAAGQAGLL